VKFDSLGFIAAYCEPTSSDYSIPRCWPRDSSLLRLSGVANVVTRLDCAQITSQQTTMKDQENL
jgi:hypothetical protein